MVDLIGNRTLPMLLAERVELNGEKPWPVCGDDLAGPI